MTWLWSCPAGARHVEGEPIAWSRRVEEHRKKPPPLVDQDLALTRAETPRLEGELCPHASRRCPP